MNKPLTVVYEDLKNGLADLINNSGLPAFMIEPILQNFLNETRVSIKRQYQLDKTDYEKALKDKNIEKQ